MKQLKWFTSDTSPPSLVGGVVENDMLVLIYEFVNVGFGFVLIYYDEKGQNLLSCSAFVLVECRFHIQVFG